VARETTFFDDPIDFRVGLVGEQRLTYRCGVNLHSFSDSGGQPKSAQHFHLLDIYGVTLVENGDVSRDLAFIGQFLEQRVELFSQVEGVDERASQAEDLQCE
jgi:hypothetical protein